MGGTRDADTLPTVRLFATVTPCIMGDVLDAGVVPNQGHFTRFHSWIVLGDTGHAGAGNALQAVALNNCMKTWEW